MNTSIHSLKKIHFILTVTVCLFIIPACLRAGSIDDILQQGNTAYDENNYEEALLQYSQAAEIDPNSIPALFNKGNSLYKLERFDEALSVYERISLLSQDPPIRAKTLYNIGNTLLSKSEPEQPKEKLDLLYLANNAYQQAFALDNSLIDAGSNLEICRRKIKEIEELINQQQQSEQQKASQQQQMQEDLESLQEKQQQLANQNNSDNQQSAKEQEQLQQETKQLAEKMNKNGNTSPENDALQDHLQKAMENQKKATEAFNSNDRQQGKKMQENAAQELQKAVNEIKTSQEQEQSANQNTQHTNEGENTQESSQQQAASTEESAGDYPLNKKKTDEEITQEKLNSILDIEKKYQELRNKTSGPSRLHVDKDW